MTLQTNVAEVERWASALGGAALAAYGISQIKNRSIAGAALAAAGGTLIYRGATGHCPMYAAAGISTAGDDFDTRVQLSGTRGVNIDEVITIDRPADELYRFWRDFARLPTFMWNLVSVDELDARRSHWKAKGPAGRTVEWDAEIINEIPGELIGWRTLDGAEVVSAGSVTFKPAPDGPGTEVRVRLQYNPPGGKVGSAVAWLFGREPSQTIQEDLCRFKNLMETDVPNW
ncbi:MAG: cyclase [Acidobacteria bacterium]|nr:MAG: cyclase [Acidobacteriota bacterium]